MRVRTDDQQVRKEGLNPSRDLLYDVATGGRSEEAALWEEVYGEGQM